MRYLSVCSGIEAATVAWHPLGWTPAAFSEIEPFPRSVLQHHYPDVPLHADFTTIRGDEYGPVDLLVGGTPCQSFSIAGLRKGLADDRGNLALEFLRLADRTRAKWVVWENVPGVLSSNNGRDFGAFLGGLGELGYGFAYRVLDAQYVRVESHPRAVPQRRRRVFVIGYLGDWRRAAAVLFEREGLQGHPAPRREAGEGVGARTARSVAIRGRDGTPQAELGDDVANAILTPNGGRGGIGVGAVLAAETGPTLAARTRGGGGLGTDAECDGGLIADWPAPVASTLNAAFGSKQGLEDQHALAGAQLFVPAVTNALTAHNGQRNEISDMANGLVAHTLRGEGHRGGEDGTGRANLLPVAFPTEMSGTQFASTENRSPALSVKHTMAVAIQERAVSKNADAGPDGKGWRDDGAAYTLEARTTTQAVAFSSKDYGADASAEVAPTMRAMGHDGSHANAGGQLAVAFDPNQVTNKDNRSIPRPDVLHTMPATSTPPHLASPYAVRRLTPTECERLQGFPDNYTLVPHRGKPAADGPRYKSLGNSMAVNVMSWLGQRIAMADKL